jgi:hypothetical protein
VTDNVVSWFAAKNQPSGTFTVQVTATIQLTGLGLTKTQTNQFEIECQSVCANTVISGLSHQFQREYKIGDSLQEMLLVLFDSNDGACLPTFTFRMFDTSDESELPTEVGNLAGLVLAFNPSNKGLTYFASETSEKTVSLRLDAFDEFGAVHSSVSY